MAIYRIRRYAGSEGGTNTYFHADVIARSPASALKAANEDRVHNWRWIDSFDKCDHTYRYYEVLGRVSEGESRHPREPSLPEGHTPLPASERLKHYGRRVVRRYRWDSSHATHVHFFTRNDGTFGFSSESADDHKHQAFSDRAARKKR